MPLLFISHVLHNLWHKLNYCLWISNFKNIVQVQLSFVLSKPVLSPEFHLFYNCLQLLLIKSREAWILYLGLGVADQASGGLDLLYNLVNNHCLVLVVFSFKADG